MTPGLWGSISAVSWGTADFIARFTGKKFGYVNALLGMLFVSCVFLAVWFVLDGAHAVWTLSSLLLLILAGLCMLVGTLLLYVSLVQGPITVAAPIAGSYPALVVLIAVVLGSRPSLLQWIGTAVTLIGVVVVARGGPAQAADGEATNGAPDGTPSMRIRRTVAVAVGAAIIFALMISATQKVVPVVGSLQTLWFPRGLAFTLLLAFVIVRSSRGRPRPSFPVRWWPVLVAQAGLDTGGYYALYAAATGPNPEIAAMASSAYYVVTVLLGRIILKERVTMGQVAGIALVFAGVITLSA